MSTDGGSHSICIYRGQKRGKGDVLNGGGACMGVKRSMQKGNRQDKKGKKMIKCKVPQDGNAKSAVET